MQIQIQIDVQVAEPDLEKHRPSAVPIVSTAVMGTATVLEGTRCARIAPSVAGAAATVFVKISANNYTFCFLDIKGYLYSMGSNLNGICGFNQKDDYFQD